MTQATPTEHSSLVGGSTAARRIGCPGSYKLEQKVPKSKGSSYAREGTALHEMMAIILEQDKDPQDLLPFTHKQPPKGPDEAWELTIDADKWSDLGEPALAAFDQFVDEMEAETGAPFEYIVEKSCEFPGIPGAFGTSDILFKCGNIRGVVDWKFGRGFVDAAENKQLMFYLTAALNSFPTFFGDWDAESDFTVAIIQPQVDEENANVWDLSGQDLIDFSGTLLEAIKLAQGDDAPVAKGGWCQFADCKVVCPLHLGAAARLGELMVQKQQAQVRDVSGKIVAMDPDFDFTAFLVEAMEIAADVESWAKQVAGMTQERIDNGFEVPGWKTVAKKSSGRDWTVDDAKVRSRLSSRGLKIDEYAPRKTITPPAAEKLLKKIGKELPDCVEAKPSSGTTLVREGDPREAAKRPVDETAALAAALAQRTGA